MIVHVLFILLCFFIDGIISVLFPASFIPFDLVFVPSLGFAALVLTNRHLNDIDATLLFVAFGMFYDYFVAREFLVYAIVFLILNFVIRLWSKHMMESVIESLLLVISTIFVKELIVYLYMYMTHVTEMSMLMWLTNRLFLTILINGILVILIIFASRTIEEIILLREKRIRKEETLSWLELLSKH